VRKARSVDSTYQRVHRFLRDYTQGVSTEELRRLFDREFFDAYEALTAENAGREPGADLKRILHRLRLLFVSIAFKLNPARRALFGVAVGTLVGGFLARLAAVVLSPDSDFPFRDGRFLFFVSALSFAYLLVLELVDKLRVRDELQVARQLQSDLMPSRQLGLPGYLFAHSYRTAQEVGGDYLDLYPVADGRYALVIGDASGHGMAAGLVMAIANATLRTAIDIDPSCERVHQLVNRALCRTGDRRTYMTLFFAFLEPATGKLDYFVAGHPFPLLRRADGRLEELGQGSLPLGLRPELPVLCECTHLAPGDQLLLTTDGLPEALDDQAQAFGYARVASLFALGGTPQQSHDRLLQAFEAHRGDARLRDDVTVLVLEREG
jgi:phosphoserine phosphatase RsbU/P